MAVMFLIISAVIAAPFAMAMVSIYSNFIISMGQNNPILSSALQVAELYTAKKQLQYFYNGNHIFLA